MTSKRNVLIAESTGQDGCCRGVLGCEPRTNSRALAVVMIGLELAPARRKCVLLDVGQVLVQGGGGL